jgi:hypothetical protein
MEGRQRHHEHRKDLDAICAHVWDFDRDRIARFQRYNDTWQWRPVLDADA